ncbi:MAG: hypothetical protein DDT30_01509 [Dehalococcoidia bacterium]|nr:hypothetical protein [Bacillota bacterium]
MMISFKQQFVETLHRLKNSKVTEKFSYVKREPLSEGVKPPPARTEVFFALAGHCVARQESFGYILVAYDMVFIVDKLAISVLTMCNGFNSAEEIKRGVREELGCPENYGGDELESTIEQALSNLAKNGITVWIPQSQVHLERARG